MSNPPDPLNPSIEEERLIRRLRTLTSGTHSLIIVIDGSGLISLSVLGKGKPEKLRKQPSGGRQQID